MSYHCPACDGVLYDRRRSTCGFCGATLPDELLFTPEQRETLQKQEEVDKLRREQREKEEAERRARELLSGRSRLPGD
jgi:hypothetical protein